ncbi:MAG: CoA pyrophosphatase [Saprospiraceae bacterium]|nr:CoA pyrophosphatase [Saprospiraceae bacterium]
MNFPQLIASLSTYFALPFMELPGEEAQQTMSPQFRDRLIERESGITYRQSGVSVLLYPDAEQNTRIVYIKRKVFNGPHSGQIGFPGGKFEEADVNVIQTALRETKEEIGVDIDSNRILGRLTSLKIPITQFQVFPILAYTSESPDFTKEEAEVEEILEVALQDLLDHPPLTTKFQGSSGVLFDAPYFALGNEKLWGATAMITAEFLALVRKQLG